jgi:hypothetical protein
MGTICKIKSEKIDVTKSIPQGSVLGCVLFLLYINDLPSVMDCPCTLFADDISVLIPCKNDTQLDTELENRLQIIYNWLTVHNLKINFTKTKLMQFGSHQRQKLQINYALKSNKLECVDSYSLLRLKIDTHINWKNHINKISTKLSRFTYALYELKKTTNRQTALNAYYAYAHAWLQYGIITDNIILT